MTKKVKTKKFNFKRFFKVLLFLICLALVYNYFSKEPIHNIVVIGNELYKDEEIIDIAKLSDYPSYLKTLSFKIENRIKKLDLIENVKVKKRWDYRVIIEVKEYKILFKNRSTNEYVISNKKSLSNVKVAVPILVNYVPDDVYVKMIDKFMTLDKEVLDKISEIEYSPNDYDSERFILYMNDGNEVYITLNKIKEFNKYTKIKEQLGSNKGVLYLDSGNYFEIKG